MLDLFRFRTWTGPTTVAESADFIRKAGGVDVFEGTEHVYFTFSGENAEHAKMRFRGAYWAINGHAFPAGVLHRPDMELIR